MVIIACSTCIHQDICYLRLQLAPRCRKLSQCQPGGGLDWILHGFHGFWWILSRILELFLWSPENWALNRRLIEEKKWTWISLLLALATTISIYMVTDIWLKLCNKQIKPESPFFMPLLELSLFVWSQMLQIKPECPFWQINPLQRPEYHFLQPFGKLFNFQYFLVLKEKKLDKLRWCSPRQILIHKDPQEAVRKKTVLALLDQESYCNNHK